MEEDKKVRYSNYTEYAYDKYGYDYTPLNFATVYSTIVTVPVNIDEYGRFYIGLKYAPMPNEIILVGKLKIPYVVTDILGQEKGNRLYRIKRIDCNDFSEGVDKVNSPVGAKVIFKNRIRRTEFSNILAKMS